MTSRRVEQKLDRILKDKQLLDKQKQDKLITTLSNTLTTAVNAKLDKLVKTEMKNTILPGRIPRSSIILTHTSKVVQQSVSLLQEKFTASMASQLAAADTAVKDGIDRLVAVSKVRMHVSMRSTNMCDFFVGASEYCCC